MADHLDLGEAVAGITAPTLVIRGDIDEPFHPLIQAVDLHSALPDSRLWIAPRTRSLMARRRPADSLRVVRDFVAEHSRLTGAAHDRALLARDATAASAVAAALSRYVQAHNVALSRRTAPPVSGPRPPRENEPVPGPPR
jgi:hypothetical protein